MAAICSWAGAFWARDCSAHAESNSEGMLSQLFFRLSFFEAINRIAFLDIFQLGHDELILELGFIDFFQHDLFFFRQAVGLLFQLRGLDR